MSEGQGIVACPKCSCAAWSWANPDGWGQDCMACGYWHHADWDGEDKEGGGFGVAACHGPDESGIPWFPLGQATQQPFTPDELAEMDWAWFSRPVEDSRWEGVAVKGSPRESWVVGVIPHYQEEESK